MRFKSNDNHHQDNVRPHRVCVASGRVFGIWFLFFLSDLYRVSKHSIMLRPLLLIGLVIYASTLSAQQRIHTLFLIGDAGEHYITDSPMGNAFRQQIEQVDSEATVLFLGDNIYPAGLSQRTSPTFQDEAEILQEQVSWVEGTVARAIFIPGNHDWEHWGKNGLQYIKNQQSWFDSLRNPLFGLIPRNGCPGPIQIELPGSNLLVILDTQWFLHQWDKPGVDSDCPFKTSEDVLNSLKQVFANHPSQRIIVAAHHPIITYGDHGGVFTLKDHIFPLTALRPKLYIPLPVVGSLYVLWRKLFPHHQDTPHPLYKSFSEPLEDILNSKPGSLYVAGHEHALQYIVKNETHYIVSGAGAKSTKVKKKRFARFVAGNAGFVRADLMDDSSISIAFFQLDKKQAEGSMIYNTTIQPK